MTVGATLRWGARRLTDHSTSPRLDAEVLLAHVLRRDRTFLILHDEIPVPSPRLRFFRRLIERRRRYVPIPYLTGRSEFFGFPLRVTPSVLVPRPFTELLVQSVIDLLAHRPGMLRIVDVGTGSGAIAIALARARPSARIIATDISEPALRLARANAHRLGVNQRIGFRRGSLLGPCQRSPQPEVCVANLPYLDRRQLSAPSLKREPRSALDGGVRGLRLIRSLIDQAQRIPGLWLLALELDPGQVTPVKSWLATWSGGGVIQSVSDGRRVRGLIAIRNNARPR